MGIGAKPNQLNGAKFDFGPVGLANWLGNLDWKLNQFSIKNLFPICVWLLSFSPSKKQLQIMTNLKFEIVNWESLNMMLDKLLNSEYLIL